MSVWKREWKIHYSNQTVKHYSFCLNQLLFLPVITKFTMGYMYIVSTSKGTVTPLQPSEPSKSAFKYPLHSSRAVWGST